MIQQSLNASRKTKLRNIQNMCVLRMFPEILLLVLPGPMSTCLILFVLFDAVFCEIKKVQILEREHFLSNRGQLVCYYLASAWQNLTKSLL